MLASRSAPARFPAAWFVKYETVMGTIGKTQGVKSDNAPTVIASQMNDHSEPPRPPAPVLKTRGPATAACDPFAVIWEFVPVAADCCAGVAVALPEVDGGEGDG